LSLAALDRCLQLALNFNGYVQRWYNNESEHLRAVVKDQRILEGFTKNSTDLLRFGRFAGIRKVSEIRGFIVTAKDLVKQGEKFVPYLALFMMALINSAECQRALVHWLYQG
jgi:hypothetical protein